jgi:hypothetical protein
MWRLRILVVLTTIHPGAIAADVDSGPARGTLLPELKVHDVTGAHAGADVDYANDRKTKPTVYLFVVADKWNRPVARFLRRLDDEVQKHSDWQVVAVWLTDEPETTRAYLPKAQQSLKFKVTALTCYPVAKKTPEPWNVNLEAAVTAVVVHEGKVVKSIGYRSPAEGNVKDIVQELQKAGGAN